MRDKVDYLIYLHKPLFVLCFQVPDVLDVYECSDTSASIVIVKMAGLYNPK